MNRKNQQQMKIYEFDPIIYPRKLWITINPNIKQLQDRFTSLEELDLTDSRAVVNHANDTFNHNNGGLLAIFSTKKDMTAEVIAHEALHVALGILEYIGFNLDYENQEPLAYLIGWCANCMESVKRNK